MRSHRLGVSNGTGGATAGATGDRVGCGRGTTKIKTDTAAARATNRTGEVGGKDQKGSVLSFLK